MNMPSKGFKSGEDRQCGVCHNSFYVYPNVTKKGQGKYCSHKCYSQSISKGDSVGYPGIHAWVRKHRGKASVCEWCTSTKAVQWSNVSREYKRDLTDWVALCKKCHIKYDNVIEKSLITKRKKDICFFTIIDDVHYYPEGTHIMVNSFKRYHPDIDLIVFRQDVINKIFAEKGINFYQAKPTFAKLLVDNYRRVVNVDADHIFLGRAEAIIDGYYDVGGPTNLNDYENASFENITEEMYVQAGMIASSKLDFWNIWESENINAMKYLRKENDILNLVWWNNSIISKMKKVIWDKEKDYYGCKSLGREPEFRINDGGETICRGEKVLVYHFARGGVFPKLHIPSMPLQQEVKNRWNEISTYGNSVTIGGI